MKIVSWNVRGLGRAEKKKEVRKLVGEKNLFIVCLQETKLQVCDDALCSSLWGNSPFGFSFCLYVGASGGLLTIWDTAEVEVWSSLSRDHVLWCHGRFVQTDEEFLVVNVYAPCDPGAKQRLWVSLSARLQLLRGSRACVCRDFNATRRDDERRSSSVGQRPLDYIAFDRFIEDNFLIDLPLCGRKLSTVVRNSDNFKHWFMVATCEDGLP
jgi:exonuclease III